MLQLFYSATFVEMTLVAQNNVKFYEIAPFLSKTTSFYKKLPPFIKNYRWPPEKKLKPLISAFIKKSIFGNNRDPCHTPLVDITYFAGEACTSASRLFGCAGE